MLSPPAAGLLAGAAPAAGVEGAPPHRRQAAAPAAGVEAAPPHRRQAAAPAADVEAAPPHRRQAVAPAADVEAAPPRRPRELAVAMAPPLCQCYCRCLQSLCRRASQHRLRCVWQDDGPAVSERAEGAALFLFPA